MEGSGDIFSQIGGIDDDHDFSTDLPAFFDDSHDFSTDVCAFIKMVNSELLLGPQQQLAEVDDEAVRVAIAEIDLIEDELWPPQSAQPTTQHRLAPIAAAVHIECEPSKKQRGYEKLYRARVKDSRTKDQKHWISAERHMHQVLAMQERIVVHEAQESSSNGAETDRAAVLRRNLERARLEARAVAQDNALMAAQVASHAARALWGFKSRKHDLSFTSMRAEINALPVIEVWKEYSFRWQ